VGDGEEPGAEAARLPVLRERGQGLEKRLAGGILGGLGVVQLAQAIPVDRGEVAVVEPGEGVSVLLGPHHQQRVGVGGLRCLVRWLVVQETHASLPSIATWCSMLGSL
jgi:hypothetical protein